MSVTPDSPFKSAPRISKGRFIEVLGSAGSPFADDASLYYDIIEEAGHDPAVWLAICGREHSFGTNPDSVLHRNNTRSWTNARSVRLPALVKGVDFQIIEDEVYKAQGKWPYYVKYMRVTDSLLDGMYRIDDPTHVYHQKFGDDPTIAEVFSLWTEGDSGPYTAYVVARVNEWSDVEVAKPKIRVALAAGHHNRSGGNAVEYELTGPITKAIAETMRSIPQFDVRVITSDDGLGFFPGSLADVAQQVVDWDRGGWPVDLFLECHTEGNGAGDSVRGLFAIYPDWGNDVDVDVQGAFGMDLVTTLSKATGIPLRRGTGLMSEKDTGVGSQGDRLGIFKVTEPLKAETTRLIIEFGAHTSPKDLAILRQPDHPAKAAKAVTEAVMRFYQMQGDVPVPDKPKPRVREFKTGYTLIGAILDAYEDLEKAGLHWWTLGVPVGAELPKTPIRLTAGGPVEEVTAQLFDRGWVIWNPKTDEVTKATMFQAEQIEQELGLRPDTRKAAKYAADARAALEKLIEAL